MGGKVDKDNEDEEEMKRNWTYKLPWNKNERDNKSVSITISTISLSTNLVTFSIGWRMDLWMFSYRPILDRAN